MCVFQRIKSMLQIFIMLVLIIADKEMGRAQDFPGHESMLPTTFTGICENDGWDTEDWIHKILLHCLEDIERVAEESANFVVR